MRKINIHTMRAEEPIPHFHKFSQSKRKRKKDGWHHPCVEVPGCKAVVVAPFEKSKKRNK